MATKRRDNSVGKEKAKSPSQAATTKLKPTPTKPNVSTASPKQTPSYLRPTTRATTTDVSKPRAKKPALSDTAHRPTNSRPKPVDKTPSPTPKTRVPTNASSRSLLSGKPVDSQKLVSGKNLSSQKPVPSKSLKTPIKEVGKRLSLATPVSNVKKSNTSVKKQEVGNGFPAREEQIAPENIKNVNTPSVVEAETQVQAQESCIAQGDEKVVQVNLVHEDQEPLDTEKDESEIDQTDAKPAISESLAVVEHEDIPLDSKGQDLEDLEEQDVNETNRCSKGDDVVADNTHKDEIEVGKEEEIALEKKEEVGNRSEANESSKETEAEKPGVKQVVRAHGKKESALSNDVIEETASKLREQRKNKVRALAGAFETVISLQEK